MVDISKLTLPNNATYDIKDTVSEFGGTNLLWATTNPAIPAVSSGNAAFTCGVVGFYNSPISAFSIEDYDAHSKTLIITETATGNRGAAWATSPGIIEMGKTYTFSCLLKPNVAVTAHMHTGWRNSSATAGYTGWTMAGSKSIPANVWTKYVFTFQPAASAKLDWEYQIGMCFTGQTTGVTCRFAHAKLEKGNKPTDWTPAPQDLVKVSGTQLQFY